MIHLTGELLLMGSAALLTLQQAAMTFRPLITARLYKSQSSR